jgi:hypothetical protein
MKYVLKSDFGTLFLKRPFLRQKMNKNVIKRLKNIFLPITSDTELVMENHEIRVLAWFWRFSKKRFSLPVLKWSS